MFMIGSRRYFDDIIFDSIVNSGLDRCEACALGEIKNRVGQLDQANTVKVSLGTAGD